MAVRSIFIAIIKL
jgi:hypothetical protein